MPVKILLADKSITIQKVVEMLFSGKEYEVLCVSDGETALAEASRVVPDVVLADVDLPRIDGYTFSGRLREVPTLSQTPVILMMSRDDVFDGARARQAAIVDHIAKPFESQDLISKVKKAVSAAPPRLAEPAPAASRPAPPKPQAPPSAVRPAAPPAATGFKSKETPPPSDIFDIIQDAPSQADVKRATAASPEDEGIFEVEPVVEVEEPVAREGASALPVGEKAVEEMREGLGLSGKGEKAASDQDIVSFESLDMAMSAAQEYQPPKREDIEPAAREWKPPAAAAAPSPQPARAEGDLRNMAEAAVSRMSKEMFAKMPPVQPLPAGVSEDVVQSAVEAAVSRIVNEIARDVIEKVAWEVVPDLAAMMIREEIERLKAET